MTTKYKKKSARILVVEDENIIALDLQGILNNIGFEVCGFAQSGEESIKKASDLHPDLILMDIKLKGKMDGITAAKRICAIDQIPIIYLSAYGNDVTKKRSQSPCSHGYVHKPFTVKELEDALDTTLSKTRKIKSSN